MAMGVTMFLVNSMLMVGYFSDHDGLLAMAMFSATFIWAFCGLFGRSVVIAAAARFISRTVEGYAEPLLRRRIVWRAGGGDYVTGTGMLVGQLTMMFPLFWELIRGPILLWPLF